MITPLPPDNTSKWHNYALNLPLAVIYITEHYQELRPVKLAGGHYGRIEITSGYLDWDSTEQRPKRIKEMSEIRGLEGLCATSL